MDLIDTLNENFHKAHITLRISRDIAVSSDKEVKNILSNVKADVLYNICFLYI